MKDNEAAQEWIMYAVSAYELAKKGKRSKKILYELL